jgi:phosphoribosylanthranilate isomerase
MRVKICGLRSEADVAAFVKSGAGSAGFRVGQVLASSDFILPSTACRLVSMLPPCVTPVIVTHLTEPESIMEIVLKTGVTTIQLHGGSSADQVRRLSEMMPLNSKLVLSVRLSNGSRKPEPEEYYPFVSAITLDCREGKAGQPGGAHNWVLAAEIVRACPLPVILAGGLTPENVGEAVKTVRPFAVSANSGVRSDDGSRSLSLCQSFVQNARVAALETGNLI